MEKKLIYADKQRTYIYDNKEEIDQSSYCRQ